MRHYVYANKLHNNSLLPNDFTDKIAVKYKVEGLCPNRYVTFMLLSSL